MVAEDEGEGGGMMGWKCLLCKEHVPVSDEAMEWAEEKRIEISETEQAQTGAAVLCMDCTEKIESGELSREDVIEAIQSIGGRADWTTEYRIEKKYRQ